MMRLNLPEYAFSVKKNEEGQLQIFDSLRKRYVSLTPEEWVRQHFVRYLITERHYPQALMGNEVSLTQNGIKRRCDTLVADSLGQPLVIIEYKAPSVPVTQATFDQVVRYNMVFHAQYLMVSNGMSHYCCRIDYATNTYAFLPQIPDYSEINSNTETSQKH
ncbi:MAG: type I restriction enzyme HsdR N-terminal domain-containing protein [Muribaculaceae bacterium]|nr:type I restriction enzyme HsdR N-terminal domain-containing protein [Muribaculaceae bacterium]